MEKSVDFPFLVTCTSISRDSHVPHSIPGNYPAHLMERP